MTTFSDRFSFDDAHDLAAKIAVVGVGGGGGNAVNNMIAKDIQGVSFVVVNTDNQALVQSKAGRRIQAGQALTRGLGAGARPQVGAEAVEESRMDIEQALQGLDMVFITAGMGGGTGTGGAPVVAQIARRLGILTVAVVTKPFQFEGSKRMRSAQEGIARLREHVDTIVTIPNQRLLELDGGKLSILDAFLRADDVLFEATRGISDLITTNGLINLDFADVKTTMTDGGVALMGSALAAGDPDSGRAERAAIDAIRSPLFDGVSISGARNVLVNITGNASLGVGEAAAATDAIGREAGDDVEVIFGTVIDDTMGDEVRVTVIATGFEPTDAGTASARVVSPGLPHGDGSRSASAAPAAPVSIPVPNPSAQPPVYESDLGIDLPPLPPAPAPLETPQITSAAPAPAYRTQDPTGTRSRPVGEHQLKELDTPAWERRPGPDGQRPALPESTPPPAAPTGRTVRHFTLDDPTPVRPERPHRDPNRTPTFLRRPLD